MRAAITRALTGINRAFTWTAPAVAVAVGALLVLDATDHAHPFSRVWLWISLTLYGAAWGLVVALRAACTLRDPGVHGAVPVAHGAVPGPPATHTGGRKKPQPLTRR